jgi:pyruvate dehydrogenase E2 component (dihydrolipoamide acetyltransferase)
MAEFRMPKLGADMTAGTLVSWRKKPGDAVARGDIIAEVETDKGVIDVEIFSGGVIERLLVTPGAHVPVGTVLATLGDAGAVPAAAPAPPLPVVAPVIPTAAGRQRISPAARQLARQLGVDPAAVQGTGPSGAVTREDIGRAAQAKPGAAPSPAADRLARMRQTIAAAMSRSKREIPHYYLGATIDLHRALSWLAAENEKRPITERLLYGVLLIKAVALALRQVPELNALWEGERAAPRPDVHVGVAVSLRQGGLIAPAIHDTDRLSLDALMQRFRDLVQRARSGSLRSSELSDPTITVTSLGEQGVETVYGVIVPPQVAIVGFGKVVERPWVVDGQVVVRPVINATLSADHRVSDGHRGGLFVAALDRLLQEPEKL